MTKWPRAGGEGYIGCIAYDGGGWLAGILGGMLAGACGAGRQATPSLRWPGTQARGVENFGVEDVGLAGKKSSDARFNLFFGAIAATSAPCSLGM